MSNTVDNRDEPAEGYPWPWPIDMGHGGMFSWLDHIDLRKIEVFSPLPGVFAFQCMGCFDAVHTQNLSLEQFLKVAYEHLQEHAAGDLP
jgi:hypothetical protein